MYVCLVSESEISKECSISPSLFVRGSTNRQRPGLLSPMMAVFLRFQGWLLWFESRKRTVWSLVMAKSRNEVCHGVSQEDRPHKNKKWSMKEKVNTLEIQSQPFWNTPNRSHDILDTMSCSMVFTTSGMFGSCAGQMAKVWRWQGLRCFLPWSTKETIWRMEGWLARTGGALLHGVVIIKSTIKMRFLLFWRYIMYIRNLFVLFNGQPVWHVHSK